MKKMKSKGISILLVMVLLGTLLAGCTKKNAEGDQSTAAPVTTKDAESESGQKPEGEPLVLTAFFKTELPWDTAVAEEITKRTGVKLEFVSVAGDPAEKLNLMMVSDSVPDLITIDRGAAANDQYITNKKVIPLDDLIAQYGPDVASQLGDTMAKIKNKDDGKIYGIPSWFQDNIAPSAVFGFNIRMNYVKELGYYDSYINKGYFTKDEFVSLLKDWKAKYPTVDGNNSIAMVFNSENEGDYTYTFKGMYGINSFYEKDGLLYDNMRNPRLREMYLFMNELYLGGLLDKDWPVTKKALYDEKISNGYVLSSPAAYWNIPNAVLGTDKDGNKTPDTMMYPFLVAADGVKAEETTYGPSSVLGWSYTYISSSNKHPEETMKFINFLMSEEGQYLTQWGREGVIWDNKDGKRVIKDEVLSDMKKDMTSVLEKEGIRKYEILFKSGIAKDGQPYDIYNGYNQITGEIDPVTAFANQYLGKTAYDTTLYDDLGPDAGTSEALIKTKIDDLMKTTVPKIILADSQEEAGKIYDQMVKDAENAGLSKIEKISNEKFEKRLEIWGDVR